MKKIILILAVFICSFEVEAKTYYSDYYLFDKGSAVKVEETDVLKRESYRLYNTYDSVRVNGEYEKDYKKCSNYDLEDYITVSERAVKEQKSETDPMYQAVNVWDKVIKEFRFTIAKNNYLNEIWITNNGKTIPFTLKSVDLPGYSNPELFMDGDLSTGTQIVNGGVIELSFAPQTVQYLRIHVKATSPLEALLRFKYRDDTTSDTYFSTYNLEFMDQDKFDAYMNIFGPLPDKSIILSNYYYIVERKYRCYDYQIKPTGKYVLEGESPNLIMDDYKEFYNYYGRYKIELDGKIVKEQNDLVKLIKSSNVPISNIKILGSVNFDKSGTYKLKYNVTDDFIVDYEVEVKNDKENVKPKEESKVEVIQVNKKNESTSKKVISNKTTIKSKTKVSTTTQSKITTSTKVKEEKETRDKDFKIRKKIILILLFITLILSFMLTMKIIREDK